MNCSEAKRFITLNAGGDLEPDELRELEGHLANCPKCRELLEACKCDRELVASLKENGPPPQAFEEFWAEFKPRLEPEVRKRSARIFTLRVLRAVTVAAVMLIVVTFLFHLSPEQPIGPRGETPKETPKSVSESMGTVHEVFQVEGTQGDSLELEECELSADSDAFYDF